MNTHAAEWHIPCEHAGCDLVVCFDVDTTPHDGAVEPGCIGHARTLCLEHLFDCDRCGVMARDDARW